MSAEPLRLILGGNAAALLEGGGARVALDPWLGERIGPWRRLRPCGLQPEQLQGLTACLISHAHPDHLDLPSLAAMSRETDVLSPGGTPHARLVRAGFRRAQALREWEAWEAPGLRVTAVPSVHTRWSLGFVLELGGRRVYFAGDASPYTPFAEIGRRCGPIDLALMPVGGSSLAMGRLQRHLTPAQAAAATAAIRPRIAVPIHWGVVPCVPAFLDRFRGTASDYVREMERLAPMVTVRCPEEGVPFAY